MAEKFLHFADINAGIEQKGGARGAERMRIVNAGEHFPCPGDRGGRHGPRKRLEISHEEREWARGRKSAPEVMAA